MEKHSKIFVAGHNGLLGSSILRRLQQQGYTNILTVARSQLDLRDQSAVDQWFQQNQPQYVFLAAARVGGIMANTTYSAEFIRDNLQIQTNVIDSAYRHGCEKLLFPGSNCVYPKFPRLPITEDQLLTGALETSNEAYAVAKIAGIKMCQHYRRQFGFRTVIIMPANLYGPGDNYHPDRSHVMAALISKFITAHEQGHPSVTLWGDGSQQREFLYADDIADACIHVMLNYDSEEPVNAAGGEEMTLKQLADIIKQSVGYTGEIIWDTTKPSGTPRKPLDVSRLRSLGWQPQFDLARGIPAAIQWYRNNR